MKTAGVEIRRASFAAALIAASIALQGAMVCAAQAPPDSAVSEAWVSAAATVSSPVAAPSALAPASSATAAVVTTRPAVRDIEHDAATASAPNLIDTPPDLTPSPPTTTEIPPAGAPNVASQAVAPPKVQTEPARDADSVPNADITSYQLEQSGDPSARQMQQLSQYISDEGFSTPLGMELHEARKRLKSGEETTGLLVVSVDKNSAAEAAGLHPYKHAVHDTIAGVAAAASLFTGPFAPVAMLVVPGLDYLEIGESYDMIIGIDGNRVSNFVDFEGRMRNLQAGELLYFSVVRNGRRIQLSMPVPATLTSNAKP